MYVFMCVCMYIYIYMYICIHVYVIQLLIVHVYVSLCHHEHMNMYRYCYHYVDYLLYCMFPCGAGAPECRPRSSFSSCYRAVHIMCNVLVRLVTCLSVA